MKTTGSQIAVALDDPSRRRAVAALVKQGGHVHLAGIGGIGMAGLAVLLQGRGFRVSGCDLAATPLTAWLTARGMTVFHGHGAEHVLAPAAPLDWLMYSAALSMDAPELAAARAAGIPLHRRGEVLPALVTGPGSVTVSGTHGKTTTTTLLTLILRAAGRDPTFCIGGEVAALGGPAGVGRDPWIVAEADESDGTAALYRPAVAVVTNIEFDHMEHFEDVAAFEACFQTLMLNAGRVVYGCDDPRAARLGAACPGARSFGFSAEANVRAVDVTLEPMAARFCMQRDNLALGTLRLPLPGRHNLLNALAAAAAAFELGVDFDAVRRGLQSAELPRRRFERFVEREDIQVVSDYAHHPSEIAALVSTARALGRRIVAVFQPHRFTRTRALGADFPAAFAGVSDLILTPVYAASEAPLEGGTIWDLYGHFRRSAAGPARVSVATGLAGAWAALRTRLGAGDLLLVIGAGDVERIAYWAREALAGVPVAELSPVASWQRAVLALRLSPATVMRAHEPLAKHTTLGVGGPADLWAEVGTLEDLNTLLDWATGADVPWRVLGSGSNTWAADDGVRGLTIRLTGPVFESLCWTSDSVTAGAALPVTALAAQAAARGLGGLEFLHGIPGTLGGAARGNAGAWGRAFDNVLAELVTREPDGRERVWPRPELEYQYRDCPNLAGRVVLRAVLRLTPAEPTALAATLREHAARREWQRGLRSAGSVFRNPPGDFAGRLLEACGCKGMTLGGARFSGRHANVIVTAADATATDVRALLELARDAVQRQTGTILAPELFLLE